MNILRKHNILAIFSNIDYAKEFVWYGKFIDKSKFNLTCIFLNPSVAPIQLEIEALGVKTINLPYRGKKDLLLTVLRLLKQYIKLKPDIIHTQLFDASFAGLIAARILGIKNRISTRHHGDLHHKYHPHAVKYDAWINNWSKHIIAPSLQVAKVLIQEEKVCEKKITVIPHGFDFNEIMAVTPVMIAEVKEKYNLIGFPVIGTISRFTEWKGLTYTIKAFKELLKLYPQAILVMANAEGDLKEEILNQLQEIPVKCFRLISFEKNIYALFENFTVFVHVPVSLSAETFGQVYIEALALRVPSVFTLSGIASEIENLSNYAEIVPYRNTEAILEKLMVILENLEEYKSKAIKGSLIVEKQFDFSLKIEKIENIYNKLLNEQGKN